jgi:tRNA(Ile)-lysidine synthetase-like protein
VVGRAEGERFRPAGTAHRRPLRKWFQERGVLPWRRDGVPRVVANGEIVAIGDIAYGGTLAAAPGEPSWRIEWLGRPTLMESEATNAVAGEGTFR